MQKFSGKSGNSNDGFIGYGVSEDARLTTVGGATAQNGGAKYGHINRAPDYYGNKKNSGSKNNNNGSPAKILYNGCPIYNGIGGTTVNSNLPYANDQPTLSHTVTNNANTTSSYYGASAGGPSPAAYPHAQALGQSQSHYFGASPSSSSGQVREANIANSSPPDPAPQPHPKQYRTTTTTITTSGGGEAKRPSNNGGVMPSYHQQQQQQERPVHLPHRTSTLPSGYASGGKPTAWRGSDGNGALPSTGAFEPPAYCVEHLASFAAGCQFGVQSPTDGIQKLKQMEKNSAVYAQPMILKLLPDRVLVEEENGTFVEQFPIELVMNPTAHQSSDPADIYNNVLLFTVKEDVAANGVSKSPPPEMHIFQCVRVSSQEVAENVHHFIKGQYHKVQPGAHNGNSTLNYAPSGAAYHNQQHQYQQQQQHRSAAGSNGPPPPNTYRPDERDNLSTASDASEFFEIDVNTLNRCFDDIERFVARIQSAAIAQRELDIQQQRLQLSGRKASKKAAAAAAQQHERSILQLRAQIPTYNEFYELFQKFKLCLNLLAKLKDHIHEPNAPELLHFLFTPLSVALDACHWGLGRNVAEQVISPLLTVDACALLRRCLTPKEFDVWMALGKSWRTPPEDWLGVLPQPYRPVFLDGFAPYGYPKEGVGSPGSASFFSQPIYGAHASGARFSSAPAPIHRGVSAPVLTNGYGFAPHPMPSSSNGLYGHAAAPFPSYTERSARTLASTTVAMTPSVITSAPSYARERSVDNLEVERLNLEKERLEFEKMKVLDKEQQLFEHERRLREAEARLEAERRLLHKEAEKQSIAGSDRPDFYRIDNSSMYIHPSPRMDRRMTGSVQVLSNGHVAHTTPPASSAAAVASSTVGSTLGAGPRHVAASTMALNSAPVSRHRDYSSSALDISQPGDPATAISAMGPQQVSPPISVQDQSPRQRAFFDELTRRRCKIVQVTYDRVAQNPKELTVARGEYLEVLNDTKNWWECRNVHNRIGYVPHTILSVVTLDNISEDSSSFSEQPPFTSPSSTGTNAHSAIAPQQIRGPPQQNTGQSTTSGGNGGAMPVGGGGPPPAGAVTGSNIINDEATPDYVKQRQGRRGEFRYF